MLEQLRRDKEERFGKGAGGPVAASTAGAAPKKPEMAPIDRIKHGLKTVRTLYTEDRNPGVAKTAF